MTPQDAHFLELAIGLVDRVGDWPIMTILVLLIIGPWLMAVFLDRAQERRIKAAVAMYENNVLLLKETQALSARQCKLEEDLQDIIMLNTQAQTKLHEMLLHRLGGLDGR